jgi:hypothetical protein
VFLSKAAAAPASACCGGVGARIRAGADVVCFDRLYSNSKFVLLARSEGDDAPHGIVRRDPDSHTISGDNFDTETAHPAAELGEHFMTRIALDTVKTAAVHCHDGALHVDEIVLAQTLAFLSWFKTGIC